MALTSSATICTDGVVSQGASRLNSTTAFVSPQLLTPFLTYIFTLWSGRNFASVEPSLRKLSDLHSRASVFISLQFSFLLLCFLSINLLLFSFLFRLLFHFLPSFFPFTSLSFLYSFYISSPFLLFCSSHFLLISYPSLIYSSFLSSHFRLFFSPVLLPLLYS